MDSNQQRDRRVAADMERVFGAAAPIGEGETEAATPVADAVPAPTPAQPPVVTAGGGDSRSRRWLLIAAPVLAALFLAVLAVRFALTLVPEANTTPPARAAASVEPPAPSAYVAAAPRAAPSTEAPAEIAPDALAPDDFGPAPVDPRTTPAIEQRLVPDRLAERDAAADVPRARRGRRDDCPPGSDADHCIYRDVMGADRRLRAAYDDATRAGVPREALVDVRKRWDRARAISLDEPDETIRRYARLTDRLDDLSRMAQQ